MKSVKNLTPSVIAFALFLSVQASAQTVSYEGSAITPGADDAYYLPASGASISGNGTPSDYTDSSTPPGQEFLTPGSVASTSPAYDLNSVTLLSNGGNLASGSAGTTYFDLAIYSVVGTTLTDIGDETFTFTSSDFPAQLDYFTLSLATPVALLADTEYAFTFSQTNNTGTQGPGFHTYLGLIGTDGVSPAATAYAGGPGINASAADPSLGTVATASDANDNADRFFDAGLSAAPEPSTYAMMLGGFGLLFAFRRLRRTQV